MSRRYDVFSLSVDKVVRTFKSSLSIPIVLAATVGCAAETASESEAETWQMDQEFVVYANAIPDGSKSSSTSSVEELPMELSETYEVLPAEEYARKRMSGEELAQALRPLTRGPDGYSMEIQNGTMQ